MRGVKVSQLLSHLAEQAIFERLELAEGEDLTFATLSRSGSTLLFGSLNEVKHVAFLFLRDLTLGNVLEDAAKRVTELAIVVKAAERLDGDLVEAPLVEEGPSLIARDAVLHRAVLDYRIENDRHARVLDQMLVLRRANIFTY